MPLEWYESQNTKKLIDFQAELAKSVQSVA
jgi:hypothetical protein